MMRTAFLFVALSLVVCALGASTVRYAGTTKGSAEFAPPSIATDGTCTVATYTSPYVTFNHTFTQAGVYEVAAMAEDDFKTPLTIFVYDTTFDPAQSCTGVVGNELGKQYSFQGGPEIDDFIYFEAGRLYHFVVTGTSSTTVGIFAVNVNPSTVTGQITEMSPMWRPAYPDGNWMCDFDTFYSAPFAKYVWNQTETGFFDVFGLFYNNTITTSFYTYLAVYRGNITNDTLLWENPCNETAMMVQFLGANDAYSNGVGVVYVQLNESEVYTIVMSGSAEEHQGYYGFQILPTKLRFPISDPTWTQPDRYEEFGTCVDSTNAASWDTVVFTAEFDAYLVDTASPYDPFEYFDTYSFLYTGDNSGSATVAPATCPVGETLVIWGDTGDITPVYTFTEPGETYTVVVSTYSGSTVDTTYYYAYMLYVMSGFPIGIRPTPPTTTGGAAGQATTTTMSTGQATTAQTTQGTTQAASTGHDHNTTTMDATTSPAGSGTTGMPADSGTTSEPVSTTSDTASVYVSVMALAVTALIAVML